MNALRLGEQLGISKATTNLARAGVLAILAGLGCSAHADGYFDHSDAMVNDSAADAPDNREEEKRFCSYVVENVISNRPGNLRTDVVGRGGVIFTGGPQTATIPFTAERGNYRARLQFVDLNGNPAADSSTWIPITH